jgi:hypothetical protein
MGPNFSSSNEYRNTVGSKTSETGLGIPLTVKLSNQDVAGYVEEVRSRPR